MLCSLRLSLGFGKEMSDSVFICLILNHLIAQYLTYKYLSHIYVYLLNIIELEQTGHMNYSLNSLILRSNCRQMTITKTFYIELSHDIIYAHIKHSFYSSWIGYLEFSRIFIIFTSFASYFCEFINLRKTCWNTWNEIILMVRKHLFKHTGMVICRNNLFVGSFLTIRSFEIKNTLV